jgi:hypothetical protein
MDNKQKNNENADSGSRQVECIVSHTEWKRLTNRAINNVSKYFKPKEVQALFDFLETVTDDDLHG